MASHNLLAMLAKSGPVRFANIVDTLLQAHMLRETNVKDVCVELGKAGKIETAWGGGNRKPSDENVIRLKNNAR